MAPTEGYHNDDHDKIIRLETNMVALVQHLDTLVETQRDTERMIQAHVQSFGHQILSGTIDLLNSNLKRQEEEIKELKKDSEEAKNVLRIIKAGAAVVLPIFTAVVVLMVKLFFHL